MSIFFLEKLFIFSLESFETYFDIVASKTEAKLNNTDIYRDILVNFLRILSIKLPYLKK